MRRLLVATALFVVCAASVLAQGKDTEKATATKKVLGAAKISVEYSDTLLQDVLRDLAEKTKTAGKQPVQFKVDPTGAASNNMKINYTAKDKSVKVVLDELCKKHDVTWTVIAGKYKAFGTKYDGFVFIQK